MVAENDPKGRKPGRLHAFDLDGKHHSYLPTQVRSPRHFDRQGDLVVVPDLDAVVTLVDADNRVVAQLGDGFTTFEQVRALRTRPRERVQGRASSSARTTPRSTRTAASSSPSGSRWGG